MIKKQIITERLDASLKIFLREINKKPLIDATKEIELSKRIQNGDIAAANELVEANLRFVVSVAKQFQKKGLPLVDLIQYGCIGALEAARRFQADRGYRFISYAVWWIRQAIMHAISEHCRTVRVPMSQVVYLNKINKATEQFEQKYNRKPSSEELEQFAELNSDKIDYTLSAFNKTVYLDSPLKEEEGGCLLDVLPNNNADYADNSSVKRDVASKLDELISNLSYREQDVLRMSFGINMEALENENIGYRFGLGSERIRQIQNEALEKLRKNYLEELEELI